MWQADDHKRATVCCDCVFYLRIERAFYNFVPVPHLLCQSPQKIKIRWHYLMVRHAFAVIRHCCLDYVVQGYALIAEIGKLFPADKVTILAFPRYFQKIPEYMAGLFVASFHMVFALVRQVLMQVCFELSPATVHAFILIISKTLELKRDIVDIGEIERNQIMYPLAFCICF